MPSGSPAPERHVRITRRDEHLGKDIRGNVEDIEQFARPELLHDIEDQRAVAFV
jgi:hypothetical protein